MCEREGSNYINCGDCIDTQCHFFKGTDSPAIFKCRPIQKTQVEKPPKFLVNGRRTTIPQYIFNYSWRQNFGRSHRCVDFHSMEKGGSHIWKP